MGQVLKDKQGKRMVTAKRSSDAAATATGASAATAVAASKRARSSPSSGPDVGAGGLAAAFERPGEIGNDARAALADMIHSEGDDLETARQARQLRFKTDPVRDAAARCLVQAGATSQIRGSLQ